MAVKGTVSSGRPTNPARNTIGVLRYLPTPRSAHTPFKFRRENLNDADLKKFWDQGRQKASPAYHYIGYYPSNKYKLETEEFPMIPRKQLEKFMPNIDIGSSSFVTPTSLMSARSGHRVTHDLIHSYDPYVGGMSSGKHAEVDHDNIDVFDKNRVGLHPDTISCRAKMFRWFRRGPFFQENHYFTRSALRTVGSSANPFVARVEAPLHTKIIRLAREGHLKSACEEYRRLSFIPPVDVFRALTAACVPDGKLADAIAILEDATHRLRYVGRDYEVFRNVMQTAVNADNADRVMWLVNNIQGTFTENMLVRAEFTALEKFDLFQRGLEFLLDKPGCEARAKELYDLMSRENLLNNDLYLSEGARLREDLLKKSSEDSLSEVLMVPDLAESSASLQQNSKDALEIVAKRMFGNNNKNSNALAVFSSSTVSLGQRLAQIVSTDNIDIYYLMRLCRFLESENSDLLAENRLDEFAERAEDWILQLSESARSFFAATSATVSSKSNNTISDTHALPYLPKSRPASATNNKGEYIRIAIDPKNARMNRNNEANKAVSFYYHGPGQRFVDETFPSLDVDVAASKYLARQPIHKEKFLELFENSGSDDDSSSNNNNSSNNTDPVVVHSSIGSDAMRLPSSSSSSSRGGSSSSRKEQQNNSSGNQQQQQSSSSNSNDQQQNDPSMEGHF